MAHIFFYLNGQILLGGACGYLAMFLIGLRMLDQDPNDLDP